MPWSRPFEEPIPLPDGRTLRTLRDAAKYLMALSPKARQSDEWQADSGAIDGGRPRAANAREDRHAEGAYQ